MMVGLQEGVALGQVMFSRRAAAWNRSSLDEKLVGRRGGLCT
jgi:hypothetical protein